MSAICGVVRRDGAMVEAADLGRMMAALAHFGPDATGSWRDGPVGLGNLALWTTPESVGEPSPWRLAGPEIVVTADARIDNREDLLRELGLVRRGDPVVTDGELIARAYEKWGGECPQHLIGDFAFAIWDQRERRLFCARDPMGVRPFFYHDGGRHFLFGSEVAAVLSDPAVPRKLDARHIALGLSGLPPFDDRSAFEAVRVLEPAGALSFDAGGLRVWKYWRLDLEREIHLGCDDDYVDACEEILQQAVAARLRTTGRVGSLLSGGLDATTSLALGLRSGVVEPDRWSLFSWALREGDDWCTKDERPFIEAFRREHPLDHAYIVANPAGCLDFPATVQNHLNGPSTRIDHGQMIPTLEAARARGVKVLLNGSGGDETVSYAARDHVLAFLMAGDWRSLIEEIRAVSAGSGISPWRAAGRLVRPLLERDRLRTPLNYQWTYRRRCERVEDLAELGIPLAQTLADEIRLADYTREVSRPAFRGGWRRPLRADQIYTLTHTHVLSDQVNAWAYASSYGIEVRCPYLDRRVVEFAVGVPPRQHRGADIRRRLLRRVALRHVPGKIAHRRGKGSTTPDLIRGLATRESEWRARIAAWETQAAVIRFLDLDRLRRDLGLIVAEAAAGADKWTPALPFCRGMMLGDYLIRLPAGGSSG